MRFCWMDYSPQPHAFVETWLDEDGKYCTGMDDEDGVEGYYTYWANDPNTVMGRNFWCKVVCDGDTPFAFLSVFEYEGVFTVGEVLVAPGKRGRGLGSAALKELLEESKQILGRCIDRAEAVIYPSNVPSKRAFEKAGFRFDHAHPDGDVLYYLYERRSGEEVEAPGFAQGAERNASTSYDAVK